MSNNSGNLFYTLTLLSVAAFSSCGSEGGNSAKAPQTAPLMNLPIQTITRGEATTYVEYAAEVINEEIVEIRSRSNGYIQRVCVKEGSLVKKGETILQIDPNEYQQRVNAAKAVVKSCEAAVAQADLEVRKITPLVEKDIVSNFQLESAKTVLESAKASLLQAKSQLSDAKIQLSYTTIKSPMTGYIGRIEIYAGSLISASSLVTTITEKSDAFAYFSYDEKKILELTKDGKSFEEIIKEMPKAKFIMSDGTLYPFEGEVEIASGIINRTTGSTQLKASFKNENQLLRSGATGKVRLPIIYEDMLLIPEKATFELQDKKMVYAVGRDSLLQTKILKVIGSSEGNYIVESGIESGERIIIEGLNKVHEGMKIAPKQ